MEFLPDDTKNKLPTSALTTKGTGDRTAGLSAYSKTNYYDQIFTFLTQPLNYAVSFCKKRNEINTNLKHVIYRNSLMTLLLWGV